MKRRILDLLRQGVALVLVYSTLILTMPVRADETPGIRTGRSHQTIASLGARLLPTEEKFDLNSPRHLFGFSEPAQVASLATSLLHRSSVGVAPITSLVEHGGTSANFPVLPTFRVALPRILATLGSGSSITVFGPQQFDRTTGPPNQYSTTFTLPVGAGSPFQLIVQNGDSAGNHRVSSGWIYVNGMQIVSPSDFSQSVATISRAIALSTQNTVQITLASQPGSFITLNITGTNPPPTANAGPNQTVFTGTTVPLNGSGSTDPSGLPLTYSWVLTSRPSGSNAALNGAGTATPTLIPDTPGTYTAQLVVNNGYSSSVPSGVTITANNSIPIANAGPPQTVYVGSTVQLDGTHSSDLAGLQLSYTWSVLSQPTGSTAVLNNASTAAPSFTADKVGAYKFQLIVNNGYSSSAPATVAITSQNLPPVANAGPPQMVYQEAPVQLNGTSSYDPAGLPLTYQWSFVSVPSNSTATLNNSTSPTPTFVADQSGNFVLQLVVNNGVFNSPPATVTISTLNAPPVANAGPAQSATINSIVQLDGSRSTDVDGDAITYAWSFVSVPTGSNAVLSNSTTVNPSFTLDVKGDYVVQLIVNDGISDSKPSTVTISTLNSPPVASAGPNQTITVTGTVQLDGSGSTDVDGDKLTYSWSFSTLPSGSQASLSNPNSVKPTFVADVLGTYVLQLVVNDGTVNGVPAIVTITSSDVPPVANPGPAQSVNVGSIATLNGSASTDSDNQPLTYQWALLSKPAGSAAALSQPTSASPYFTADVRGEYVIQLIVNDGFLSSAPLTVTVSTIDTPPVANAGTNQTINAGTTVQLSGAASNDADGDPITYQWAILTQPAGGTAVLSSPTVVNPSFVANVAGIYVAQLIVNDGTYNSQPVTVTITANAVNQAPLVSAGANQTITLPANTVTLNGTATDDGLPNNTLTIAWSVVSGPGAVTFSNSSSAVTQATFSVAGTYVLQLTANDSLLSTSAATTVIVNPSLNQPPVVSAGPNQTITLPTNLVTLSGSATDDGLPNGNLSITWSQVSGPAGVIFGTPNQAVTIATFPAPGTYVLQLTANDSQLSASSVVTVTVNPAPVNQPPVVSAGPNQTLTLPNTTATLNGSATDDGLPNGTLNVSWTVVSGPTTVTFSNPTQAVTQATFNGPGLYVLQLSANDSQLTSSAQVSVYVYQQGSNGQNQPPFVNAGPDQTIVLPASAQLNGLVIDDGLPNGTLNIAWSMLTGPGTVTFTNSNAAVTAASFSMAGTYVLTLSASDSVLTSSANVTITVGQLDGHGGYKGTDFWVMFPQNFDNCATGCSGTFQPELIITSDVDNSGTVTVPGLKFSSNFTVVAGQAQTIQVPVSAAMATVDQVENKGIHVTSQSEITLVGLSYYTASTDGYLGLPTPILGTQYLLMAWPKTPFHGSQLGIVAPYDGTTVTIVPTVNIAGHLAGKPYSVVLNQGRTYALISNGQGPSGVPPDDLTGTSITSDKPIAVFGGNQCANIPRISGSAYSACNHVVEEIPPTDLWGENFLTVPIATHSKGEVFRILAANDGTNVTINGVLVATLNHGEFYETILSTPSSIDADGPVLVAQFETSQQYETGSSVGSSTFFGDPSMFLVPPHQDFGGHYTVLTPTTGFRLNYVNVVAPTSSTASVTLDGAPVSAPFAAISGTTFSGAQVPVSPGVHHFNGTSPFGLTLYGLEFFDSYSYQAGLVFDSARSGTTITLTPSSITQQTGTTLCLTASLYDGFGTPPGGIGVGFTVTGANPSNLSVDTNSAGQAQYCYVGTNSGADSISASIGTISSTANITWNSNNPNRAPIVFAGNDATITLPGAVGLYGVVSDDGLPSGSPLTISWTEVSGPGTVTFGDSTQPVTKAAFSTPGTYDLRLTADDSQLSSYADVTVTVNAAPANQAPVVNPGSNQTIYLPNTATMNGIVTDDGLPSSGKLTIQWSEVSGPANSTPVVFSSPRAAATQATFVQPGTYVLQLAADDSQLQASGNVTVTVIALNQPPRVSAPVASPSQIQLPVNTVSLSSTVTDDGLPTGSTLSMQWTETSGPAAVTFSAPQQASTQATLPSAGAYVLSLTATDGQYTVGSSVLVRVLPANTAPVVSVTPTSQTISLPTNTVGISGTVTDDGFPTGSSLTETWTEVSGPAPITFSTPNQAGTQVTFSAAGTYTLQLTASDSQLSTSAIATVTVKPANQAPTVSAGPNQTISLPSNSLTLKGTVTDDGLPTGATVTSSWTEVSGPAAVTFSAPTNPTTNVTFTTAGTYDLRLTASDTQLTGSADVTITVFPGPQNQPPVVTAGPSFATAYTLRNSIFLNGSATDDGLPTGSHLTIAWTELSGPASCTILSPASPQTSVSCPLAGTYSFQISANDTQLTSTASNTVIVLPPVNQPPSVNAGGSQTITLPNSATLNGTVTDDGLPSGTLSIQWVQLTGPAAMSFATPNQAVTQATFPVSGIYQLRLMASDSQLTSTSDVFITVNPASQPPAVTVNPAATSLVIPGGVLQLAGTVSDPTLAQGQSLTYQWIESSGPAPVTFSTPNALTTQATFTVAGTYQLQLTATDGQLTGSGTASVVVNNLPAAPQVALLSPADGAELTKPTTVLGTINADPNSVSSVSLQYSVQDGSANPLWVTLPTSFGSAIPFISQSVAALDPTGLAKGVYTLKLTLTDRYGQSATSTTTFVISKNAQVGQFSIAFTDLNVPVGGLPITITRSYNSSDISMGDFGRGWKMGLSDVRLSKTGNLGKNWNEYLTTGRALNSYCLQSKNGAIVTVTFPDGKVYKFSPVSTPQCSLGPITSPTVGFTELPGSPGTAGATLVPADGGSALVDAAVPGPVDLVDFNTNFYNPTTFILNTRDGYRYVIDQQLGVTSLTDPNGNSLTINSNGVVSSTGASITFTRDAYNRITQISDPNSNSLTYSYDDSSLGAGNGPLVNFTDGAKNKTQFAYLGNKLQSITDPRGNQILTNSYDTSSIGHLSQTRDINGNKILYNIDTNAQTETITDRLGNPTTYTYDDDGNILSMKDALGNTTTYTYDINDNKLTETNPLGKTTKYAYDQFGNRLTETDPLGNKTSYTYNAAGQVLTVTDPNGHTTTNVYDPNGNLLSTTDANGKSTSTIYNKAGLPTQVTDAAQNITKFSYDNFGRLATQTDALNNVTTYAYDSNGNKQSQTVTRTVNGQPQTITTGYQYDGDNRLIETDYADGTKTQIKYDADGKQSSTIDQFQHATTYTYDTLERLTKTTYFDGTFESATYDAENHRLTSTDRNQNTTTYTYDADGRLSKTTYADTKFTKTHYDAAGRVDQTTDANGNVTNYGYDDAGRRTTITDALTHVTTFAYDNAGNQLSVKDANQNLTQYVYDTLNRQTQVTYPDQSSSTSTYDALGRVISKTDQAGKVTAYGYDKLGRLTSVTQDAAQGGLNLLTQYGYDEVGNRTSQTDANNHTTTYAYDNMGRRTSRTLPMGQSESYAYDAAGNLKSKTDFNGHVTRYAYDSNNRLLSKTPDAAFSAQPITFTYFANGQRKTMADPSGTTSYTYDPRNRLTQKQTPEGTLNYSYDAAGNLLTLASANANGASDTYTYDALNRLSTVADSSGTTNYTYDNVGNLQSFAYPNGVTTSYAYDTLNRLNQVVAAVQGAPVASYAYTLGAAGNRTSVAELSGRTVSYGYDALYRLTQESVSGDPNGKNGTVSYAYDNVGNRQQMNSTLGAVPAGVFFYNNNDQLTTDTYDANGNTTASAGIASTYDFENHMVQKGAVTIVYDGDGNRVAETVGGVTTKYLVDTQNPTGYAQVVDEIQNGAVTKTYSYGLERISQNWQPTTGNWQRAFYGYDGHSSVRFLTSSAGTITDTYDYDAFGNLTNQTGTTPNNYLFAGEQFDPALNLYYNRARYLNTSKGRFWSMDSYEGQPRTPPSLHKYLYASANPVDRVDTAGTQDVVSELGAESIASTLNNITGIQGQAIMDQIKYGGNAGLKSLFITGAIIGGAIAIQSFGSFAREIPLLKAGTPGSVIANEMSAVEVELAQEVVEFRGGTFVGQTIRDMAGIDGFLEGVPASLKTMTSIRPGTLFLNVVDAARKAQNAGYAGVEVFISAKGFSTKELVGDPTILPRIAGILREGTLSAVSILSANGWIRVVP